MPSEYSRFIDICPESTNKHFKNNRLFHPGQPVAK
jgi:hypothetical protein